MESTEGVHPLGEGKLGFETHAGQVFLEPSADAMTPFGGFVPLAAFVKKVGVLERLAESFPVERTSPNASRPYDVLVSFALATWCDGSRFAHINRLREDPVLAELFGVQRVVSDDTVRRLFRSLDTGQSGEWIAEATQGLWRALPERFILDWDSTVQTRYGHQEGAQVGYNPHKRGRRSHHPLLAVVAGTRLCPYYRWRDGKVGTAAQWIEAMEEAQRWMGTTPWLNRGDIGFCSEELIRWHEAPNRPNYLFKLRLTQKVKATLAALDEADWQGCPTPGILQTAEVQLQLHGWSAPRRVVFGRRLLGHTGGADDSEFWAYAKYDYEAYVTDLPPATAESWQIIELYRQRADCENVFDELKNQWGFSGFCSQSRAVHETAMRLLLVTYNLWNLFLRLLEPSRHIEAKHGRRWFLFIGAKLVRTARQRTLRIGVSETWWNALKQGYERVHAWLDLTAPQLHQIPPDTLHKELNCGN